MSAKRHVPGRKRHKQHSVGTQESTDVFNEFFLTRHVLNNVVQNDNAVFFIVIGGRRHRHEVVAKEASHQVFIFKETPRLPNPDSCHVYSRYAAALLGKRFKVSAPPQPTSNTRSAPETG